MICAKDVIRLNTVNVIPVDLDDDLTSVHKNATTSILEIGKKLLHCAREGDSQGVIDLLGKGAPITTDWLGTSPLHLAVMNNHYETCDILIRAGVGKDGRTKVDRTPLHFAAYEGYFQIAKLLLCHGADVDCRDMLQMTPLHWAVERGHEDCVHVLLSFGAKPDAVSRFNKTPLSIAMEMDWIEIVQALQKSYVPSIETLNGKQQPTSKFTLNYDDDLLNLNNEKTTDSNNIGEMESDNIDTLKDAQSVLASLLPQVEHAPNEATLQLLKKYGITMLPADNTNTVNSAIQSGRKVVLSDAGKLVLKDVNLQKEPPKSVDIKKAPIILPSAKMKNTKIYTISSSQFLAMTAQAKPNILQKFPIETLKKAASNAGLSFVQLPKNASISPVKVAPLTKNIKMYDKCNVPIKTVPSINIVKKTDNGITIPVSSNSTKAEFRLGQVSSGRNPKIIKLKSVSNLGNAMKVLVKKNRTSDLPDTSVHINVSNTGDKNSEINPISIDSFSTINDCIMIPNGDSNISEVDKLKSELALAKIESEYYKKRYEETHAELLLFKNKLNCHSLMDGT